MEKIPETESITTMQEQKGTEDTMHEHRKGASVLVRERAFS